MSEGRYIGWRKSSYSNSSGNCVEVASATWRKPGHSDGTGNCAEVANADRFVAVRDSKQDGRGPLLEVAQTVWRRFLASTKSGDILR